METLRASAEQKETIKALEWISPTQYPARYKDILENRTDGTVAWFLKSSKLQAWSRLDETCLYCSGEPGTGKTVIAAMSIEHATELIPASEVAYIFCDYKTDNSMRVTDCLAALLQQLAPRHDDITRPLLDLYGRYSEEEIYQQR